MCRWVWTLLPFLALTGAAFSLWQGMPLRCLGFWLLLSGLLLVSTSGQAAADDSLSWPLLTNQVRPWAYWWWLGNAATEGEITRQLELFRHAGLGGVHIIPIYGAKGYEDRYIPFLSDRWLQLLAHTLQEGKRLGIGVDMTLGTGWNLGGPWIDEATAAKRVLIRTFTLRQGERMKEPLYPEQPYAVLHALVAFGPNGQTLDLTQQVNPDTKRLDWTPLEGEWKLYAVFQVLHGMRVKRAAPGGEGYVMDFFSRRALERYLLPFSEAFQQLATKTELKVRAIYHDSFEVIGENWTDNFLEQFQRRRGYDLRFYLPALLGESEPEIVMGVRSDFRQTVAELILEEYALPWVAWAHQHGFLVRYEAHGSPGDLLDLYAAADIPESELFGPDCLELVGLSPLMSLPKRGKASPKVFLLFLKFASSAAHVTGKPLCANETATWLGEHFTVPLEHVKAQVDLLFLSGINHIFYHGIPFSPQEAPWPGWLFYASTHFGPTNTFWVHFPALNDYIARCQSFLQLGQHDNDLLLYFPIFDLWATDEGSRGFLHFLVANGEWLERNLPAFTRSALHLMEQGYSFDLISDRMVKQLLSASENGIATPGGIYRSLLIAHCHFMPVDTFERLLQLVEQGATVLVLGDLPKDVPGLTDLVQRRQRFAALRRQVEARWQPINAEVKEARIGQGRLLLSDNLTALLNAAQIPSEPMTKLGLRFIRRKESPDQFVYFVVNLRGHLWDGWVPLSVAAQSVVLFDPMHGHVGIGALRQNDGRTEVYLQLQPRQSLILRLLPQKVQGRPWAYYRAREDAEHLLTGSWQVEFTEGGPKLPKPATVTALSSWTEWTHDDSSVLKAFSGTAHYRLVFDLPSAQEPDAWLLDLGTVCYSARVWLNGSLLGTLIASPFQIVVPKEIVKPQGNELVVEVANLMANRIIDMDKRSVPWQQFFFVNILYQPFSAANWQPLPSGLLGPVRLVPMRRINPPASD